MGYALPSGVVNTDSAYYYVSVNTGSSLVTHVKQLTEQTLVVIDYSQIEPTTTVDGFSFSVDVTSNPALVVSYAQLLQSGAAGELSSLGSQLIFLVSGGIAGQMYTLGISVTSSGVDWTDWLSIQIPSSADCACETINPVPALYTQLPLGEPTQGYVNSGVRYFWGAAPPSNPNVMDQWFNTDTETLSEWVTDGVIFGWEVVASTNLVIEAPEDSILYGRYNGFWVTVPIQADAPADGVMYTRRNNNWYALPQYITEAPGGGVRFGRYNGTWQADAIQVDAPVDGNTYARNNGVWVRQNVIIPDAPMTGLLYSRSNSNWLVTPIQADAPNDGQFYARNNNAWLPLTGQGLQDAPTDGTLYGRQNGLWAAAYPASNPANYQSAANVVTALSLYMPLRGGNFTGAIGAPGLILANGPATLQISGGQPGQILVANASNTFSWGAAPIPDAPANGTAYARQNNTWVPTASGGGIADAPSDGTTYSRNDATWVHLISADITDLDTTLAPYALTANIPPSPAASTTPPSMDGTAAVGTGTTFARADHVHPSDTSRYAASNPSGYQTAAQVANALTSYALIANVPVASNAVPAMDSVGSSGSSPAFTRGDHVHPTDTTRVALTGGTMTGILTLVGNPINPLDAVPMQYVTSSVANANIDCGTF
jgi:hypothetical protein